MKYTDYMHVLKHQQNLLLDFLPITDTEEGVAKESGAELTKKDKLRLCSEIARLEIKIEQIGRMPFSQASKEMYDFPIEIPSSMNDGEPPPTPIEALELKKIYYKPYLFNSWNRA